MLLLLWGRGKKLKYFCNLKVIILAKREKHIESHGDVCGRVYALLGDSRHCRKTRETRSRVACDHVHKLANNKFNLKLKIYFKMNDT